MALMEKMSLGQAAGGPGGGKLKKFIKRKISGYKMKQAKKDLENIKNQSNISGNEAPVETPLTQRQENRQERRFNREINRGVRKDNRMKERAEKNKSKISGSSYSTKINKYSNPGLYKVVKVVKNIGDAIDQAGMRMKKNKGRRLAMLDAAGPTSRNKSVSVCGAKDKNCQK